MPRRINERRCIRSCFSTYSSNIINTRTASHKFGYYDSPHHLPCAGAGETSKYPPHATFIKKGELHIC